jgi:recombination protein RecA
MKMKETSRAQDKKLAVNNYLGRALKFYSSVRLDVRRIETIKTGGDATGNRVRIKVVKNKVAPPFKEAEIDIVFAEGISKTGDLVDVASQYDVIQKTGAW